MKNLLVTGGAGFIGSNFIRHVLDLAPGWLIVNLDVLTYAGNPMNFKNLSEEQRKRYRFVAGSRKKRGGV